jgi:hypothetical protein
VDEQEAIPTNGIDDAPLGRPDGGVDQLTDRCPSEEPVASRLFGVLKDEMAIPEAYGRQVSRSEVRKWPEPEKERFSERLQDADERFLQGSLWVSEGGPRASEYRRQPTLVLGCNTIRLVALT